MAGRFRVLRFLGQGGVAQVYEADDLELGQSVALKVLRSDIANDTRAAKLLKTEVLLARRVTHPNVCRIFDVFQHPLQDGNGSPATVLVVAMELLRGETLAARLRRGRLTAAEAFPLVQQIAEGLAAAHSAGVAHLDLKSGNVILVPTHDGVRAVITDFGLAQRTDLPDGLTAGAARFLRGTAAYMAPEQVAGEGVTAAADLYALGVVVYEMVTSQLPFRGATPRATAEKRLSEPPTPPRVHAPDLAPAWDQAILRCLKRNPRRRFGSALEFVAALAGEASAKPTGRSFEWQRPAAICGVLALLASSSIFLLPWRTETPAARAGNGFFIGTASPDARRLYEQGMAALRASEALAAVRLLEHAVAIDPEFGLAHSALADAWAELGYGTRAQRQAQRALELSAGLPQEQRLAVEARYAEVHGKWETAIRRYEALWTFFPDNVEYALKLAAAQTAAGRNREALATIEALRRPRPLLEDLRIDLVEAEVAGSQSDFRRQLTVARRCASRAQALGRWRILGRARLHQGKALRAMGELRRALSELAAAREAFLKTGDRAGFAQATIELAVSESQALQIEQAERRLAEARSVFRTMGNRVGEGEAMHASAQNAFRSGRMKDARSRFEAALAVFHELGHRPGERRVRADLGVVLANQGRLAESARLLEQDLISVREFGDRQGEAITLMSLAEQVRHWDLREGTRLLEEALSLCHRIGNARCSANVLMRLGCARREAGEFARAEGSLLRSRRLFRAMGNRQTATAIELRLARIYLEQGRAGEAANLARAAATVWAVLSALTPFFMWRFARLLVTPAAAALTAVFTAAWPLQAQGRRAEAAEALARARALLPHLQSRVETVRTLLVQGRVLHILGRTADADELLARAEHDAEAMGSTSLRIEAALARVMIRRGSRGDCSPLVALAAEAGAHSFSLLAAKATAARQDCQRTL